MGHASGQLRTPLSNFIRRFFTILGCSLAAILLSVSAVAQSTTDGAIGGTVYDAHDAAVAGASVVVRNNGTNREFKQTTNDSGYFRVTGLTPATYSVTVTAAGFSGYEAKDVTVTVGRVTEITPKMGVAGTTEKIVVTGEAPEVNTVSPDFAPTLNQVAIQNLPINGGRWSNFVLLTPGVNNNLSGFGLVSFRGISSLLNNNTVDGADNNQAFFSEERGRTRAGYSSPKIAVQEFQVNTSNYSAEYGRAAGGVVNTVTKSGTNQFHGDAYFYDRDSAWFSINPFTTLTTQTSPGVYTTSPFKPTDIRKIWGGDIGGYIIKDKLFFYVAYDNFGRNFPGTAVATSPSAFFDTTSATYLANVATLAGRLGISNAAAAVDWNNGLNGLLTTLGPVARTGNQNITLPKIDWVINDKNRFSAVFNRMRWGSPAGIQTQSSNTFGIASFGNDYVQDTWLVTKLNSLITTNISNDLRYQWGRDNEFENNQTPTPYEQNTLVAPVGYSNPLGLPPQVSITNGWTIGVPSFLERPKYPDEVRNQVADTVSWIKGKHSFKFGGDYNHVADQTQNLRFQYGGYSYSSLTNYFSDLYGTNTCTATVSGKVVHVPCYSSYTQAFGALGATFNTNDLAFFAEDQWKVTPRLTLDLGLRYEYEMLPSPYLVNPLAPQTADRPADKNNWGPRVGFAYDIFGDGSTSLRGGWGMYYGRIINSTIYNALLNTGVSAGQLQYSFTATQGGPIFPQIINPATPPSGTIKPSIVFFDQNFQAPQIQQIDLIFERQLGWNTTLSLSYLGSLGRHLPDFVDTNLTSTPSTINYTVVDPNHLGPITASTLTGLLYNSRPNTNFGSMTDIFSGVNSSYNAFAVQVNHSMSHNVQFSANYTWAHAIDFGQNESTFSDTNDLLNPYCLKCEYGNSNFDVRQRFTANAVIDSWWNVKGWAGYLANGWELAPIFQAQTGLPYSLVTSGSAPGGASGSINGSGGATRLLETGRNTYRYPNTYVVDLRLSKNIKITEKVNMQVLAEVFNLANHLNVTGINNTGYIISTCSATQVKAGLCTLNAPVVNYNSPFRSVNNGNSNFAYSTRQIQIGAKLSF